MDALGKFLAYGAIGLGLALAVLAYRLLSKEQAQPRPRREMFKPIYVFMAFSLVLCLTGFALEFAKSGAGKMAAVEKQNEELLQLVEKLKADQAAAGSALAQVRGISAQLLALKSGKIDRLYSMSLADEHQSRQVKEIADDFRQMDIGLRTALAVLMPGSPLLESHERPPAPHVAVVPPPGPRP